MSARRTRSKDTGTPQDGSSSVDEVSQSPPPEAVRLPEVKPRNRKNMFNTELLLEAAKPEYNAEGYDELIQLCGYETSPALRTRVSQLVNSKRLAEKFRPPAPTKGKKA